MFLQSDETNKFNLFHLMGFRKETRFNANLLDRVGCSCWI